MKKPVIVYVFISIFFITACSSTHFIEPNESKYDELNNKLKGKNGTLTLTNGLTYQAENIFVKPDSVSWTEKTSKEQQKISIQFIHKIEIITNRGLSALKGLGLGILSGALVGVVLVDIANDSEGDGYVKCYSAVIGGGFGGFLGLVSGASYGRPNKFIFKNNSLIKSEYVEIEIEYIDLETRNQYGLFPDFLGFQSAKLTKMNGKPAYMVTYKDEVTGQVRKKFVPVNEVKIK